MARGSTNLTLDEKGRIAVPTRLRPGLVEESGGSVVITVSPAERCLSLYTLNNWVVVEAKLTKLPSMDPQARRLRRLLIGHAHDCGMDRGGRILLPAPLREFAFIEKQVVLVGQGDKFEIWSEDNWLEHRDSLLVEDINQEQMSAELLSLVV